MDAKEVENCLKLNNIKPSYQRIKIYEYLVQRKNHPTVDMIYRELSEDIPTLSKTTVYNTLNLFVEKGVAQLITIDEHESRYDADVSLHGHFRCKGCSRIYDFKVKLPGLGLSDLADFQIDENHIYFKGYCPECRK